MLAEKIKQHPTLPTYHQFFFPADGSACSKDKNIVLPYRS